MKVGYRLVLLGTSMLACAQAAAQMTPGLIPPDSRSIDENGVDLGTGEFIFSPQELSIGSGESELVKDFGGGSVDVTGGVSSIEARLTFEYSPPTMVVGSVSDQFAWDGSGYGSIHGNGARLNRFYIGADRFAEYIGRDGTKILFRDELGQQNELIYPISITRPNGQKISFNWQVVQIGETRIARLLSKTNNAGYAIKFKYATMGVPNGAEDATWFKINAATALNTAVVGGCDLIGTGDCDTLSGVRTARYTDTTYTNPAGQTTTYYFNGVGQIAGWTLPGSTNQDMFVGWDTSGRVTTITRPSGSYTYVYSDAGGVRTVNVTGPTGTVRTVQVDLATKRITSDAVAGRSTRLRHDSFGRVTQIKYPEENSVNYTYDARGNITSVTNRSKDNSGEGTITVTAAYPAICSNPVICNKPTSTTDGRGKVTWYGYDPVHGGLTNIDRPGESRVAVEFAPVTAQSGGTVMLPTSVQRCQNDGSCDRVTTTTAYLPNLLPSSVTAAGPDASATMTYTYTPDGDVDTATGPVAGMATRSYYDALRRVIGVIGPDPDGSGPLKHRAANAFYRPDGLVDKVQIGTANDQSATAGQSFSTLQTIEYGYDPGLRRTSEKLIQNGQTYAHATMTYDGVGRLTDRIVHTGDSNPRQTAWRFNSSDGRLHHMVTGAGQPEASTIIYGYSDNGLVTWMRDGENRTTNFAYDGFDRLKTTTYADGSTEVLAYDANGNVTSTKLRDGQTVTLGYDDANRQISRSGAGLNNTYGYDLLGRLVSATGGEADVTRGYDALGRMRSETVGGYTVYSGYDAAGRRTRQSFNNPNVSEGMRFYFDATGAMTRIADGADYTWATFGYDDLGRRTAQGYFNGRTTSYGYSGPNLTSLTHNMPGGPGNGPQNSVTFGFGYNLAGQITTRTTSNDEYVYIAPGNLDQPIAFNALNQPVPASGFTHDARGNLTNVTGTTVTPRDFAYSADDKLTRRCPPPRRTGPISATTPSTGSTRFARARPVRRLKRG